MFGSDRNPNHLKLGIDIGETSLSKYLVGRHKPPSQAWRTFFDNHLKTLVSVDFFTVPTIRFQVVGGELQNRPEFPALFEILIRCRDVRHPRRFRPFDRHRFPPYKTGWPSCRRHRIRADWAPDPHPESQPEASSLSERLRPDYRRFTHPSHAPSRVLPSGMVLKPSTLLHFNHVLTKRKYRILFSCQRGRRRGPKGPTKELIDAVWPENWILLNLRCWPGWSGGRACR
jgi:hypothetical protein